MVELGKNENTARVNFVLFLDNPEHKRVHELLKNAENKNQLIRNALLAYEKQYQMQLSIPSADDIRTIVSSTVEQAKEEIIQAVKASASAPVETQEARREIDFEKLKKKAKKKNDVFLLNFLNFRSLKLILFLAWLNLLPSIHLNLQLIQTPMMQKRT